MRQEERFNNILNECLDRILKGETVEKCLLSYPEQAKELEPLLQTAKAARVISSVQPRPEFKAEARRQFQAALIEMKVNQNEHKAHVARRWQWRWQSGWAIVLIVVVMVVLGGGGTVAAASGSMPDSGLYSVKLATEQVQLALAPGEIAKTQLNAKFADRRTEEIIYTAEKGNAQEVQVVASRLNTNLSNISGLAAGNIQPKSESNTEPAPVVAPQPAGQSKNASQPRIGVTSAAPTVANPNKTASSASGSASPVAPSPAADSRFAAQSAENTGSADTATGNRNSNVQSANNKVNSAKYEKLKKIIQDNYDGRKQKLEAALQNTSQEVRPAIRQAIAQSDLEYARALKNLEETEKAGNAQNSTNSGSSPNIKNTPNNNSNRK